MVIFVKILRFFSNISKAICLVLILLLISMILVSFKLVNEKTINPYCENKYENEIITLEYKEIKQYKYKFECNTLNFNIEVVDYINKQEVLSLLLSIGKQIQYLDCYTHFEVTSDSFEKAIYASIDLSDLSLSYIC